MSGLRELRKELVELDTAIERLYEAVEKGLLPMDDTLAGRAAKLKARRETLLRNIDGAGQARQAPLDLLSPATMEAFSRLMRRRLLDCSSGFPKRYLHELVSERDHLRRRGGPDAGPQRRTARRRGGQKSGHRSGAHF